MTKPSARRIFNIMLWIILTLIGTLTIIVMVKSQSEPGSAILFGYSRIKLLILLFSLAIWMVNLGIVLALLFKPSIWKKTIVPHLNKLTASPKFVFLSIACGWTLFLLIISFFLISLSPASNEAVILKTVIARAGWFLIWIELILVGLLLQFLLNRRIQFNKAFSPFRIAILFLILEVIYLIAIKTFAHYAWEIRFRNMEYYLFLPAVAALIWTVVYEHFSGRPWYRKLETFLLSTTILLVAFTIFRHTSQWMEWQNTASKTYWHLLAESFLQGRLYLVNPDNTHDLTLYQGQWYVPNPPLPAFMVLPFVAVFGVQNINMVIFSIWWSAITVIIVFWMLESASAEEIIPTNRSANLWITALFGFGTCFWWLAVMGRMWFLSQVFTVLFSSLAALLAVRKKSPFLIGASLGLAIMARPNLFTVWPFLLGIFLTTKPTAPHFSWKQILSWSTKTAFPMIAAVAGLLFYNKIRFGNIMDFGYVTISSAEWLMERVQSYGMFHPHFFNANFKVMALDMPRIFFENGCLKFAATREGYSIISMTPAIIFIFRRFKKEWWFAGAWTAVVFSVCLLMLYHNTGAWQLGYRYLMDFIIPILFLVALGVGRQPGWGFIGLAVLSLLGNLAGIIWWFNKWPC